MRKLSGSGLQTESKKVAGSFVTLLAIIATNDSDKYILLLRHQTV